MIRALLRRTATAAARLVLQRLAPPNEIDARIETYLRGRNEVTLQDLMRGAELKEMSPELAGTIRVTMRRLGWERAVVISNNGGHTVWRRRSS